MRIWGKGFWQDLEDGQHSILGVALSWGIIPHPPSQLWVLVYPVSENVL